jgi:hypothetical protein
VNTNGHIARPIETRYRGYRFRSRLEARWAVFFDALGVPWEYEREGYDLGEHGYYLPDFWLPDHAAWFEVKPGWPNDRESAVAQALADRVERTVYVAMGGPAFFQPRPDPDGELRLGGGRICEYLPQAVAERQLSLSWDTRKDVPWDDTCWWGKCPECSRTGIGLWGGGPYDHAEGCSQPHGGDRHPHLIAAVEAARAARFEHGETPWSRR